MTIHISDLRKHVVRPTLEWLGDPTPAAERLVMCTAAHESHFGSRGLVQRGNGPALGIYQMEPNTYDDLWENGIGSRMALQIHSVWDEPHVDNLIHDLKYATAMCRLQYRRFAEPLPAVDDLPALARYWKAYWNTSRGAGSVAQFVADAQRHGV